MALRRQPNGIYLVEFQLLGTRVHQSTRTRSLKEARAFEDRLRAKVRSQGSEPAFRRRVRMSLGKAIQRYEATHLRLTKGSDRSFKSTQCLLRKLQ